MHVGNLSPVRQERIVLESRYLNRGVTSDVYFPAPFLKGDPSPAEMSLLLINDGQELGNMGFPAILDDLYGRGMLMPLLCVGIHAGPERHMEYGTAVMQDFQGWGARAGLYGQFVMEELLPEIRFRYKAPAFREKAFAGFSLGALSAMDIVWGYAREFSKAGLFSGSFWWRKRDKRDPMFNEATDRIMQQQVAGGGYYPWMRFFFECGTEDEYEDRNNNGIIDSIDDTLDLIRELAAKGYDREKDIRYLEIAGGRHDVETWGRAMPEFLLWGWGKK